MSYQFGFHKVGRIAENILCLDIVSIDSLSYRTASPYISDSHSDKNSLLLQLQAPFKGVPYTLNSLSNSGITPEIVTL